MSYLRDRIIVLKKEAYRERDRRYVWYGVLSGLGTAVARGSAVPYSKQAGHLEPFSESEVLLAHGRVMNTIAVARVIPLCSVRMTSTEVYLAHVGICGAFTDLLLRLIHPGIPDERIFLLLEETIRVTRSLPRAITLERGRILLLSATLKLLDLLGYAPSMERLSGDASVSTRALCSFMRRASLQDILRVTAPVSVIAHACQFVEQALQETPLDRAPQGLQSLHLYL